MRAPCVRTRPPHRSRSVLLAPQPRLRAGSLRLAPVAAAAVRRSMGADGVERWRERCSSLLDSSPTNLARSRPSVNSRPRGFPETPLEISLADRSCPIARSIRRGSRGTPEETERRRVKAREPPTPPTVGVSSSRIATKTRQSSWCTRRCGNSEGPSVVGSLTGREAKAEASRPPEGGSPRDLARSTRPHRAGRLWLAVRLVEGPPDESALASDRSPIRNRCERPRSHRVRTAFAGDRWPARSRRSASLSLPPRPLLRPADAKGRGVFASIVFMTNEAAARRDQRSSKPSAPGRIAGGGPSSAASSLVCSSTSTSAMRHPSPRATTV